MHFAINDDQIMSIEFLSNKFDSFETVECFSFQNYIDHVMGTASEWLMAIVFEVYILSFAIELRNARCHAPKLRLTDNEETGDQSRKISASATKITFLNEV